MRYLSQLPIDLAERVRYFESLPRFATNDAAYAFSMCLEPFAGSVGVVIENAFSERYVVVPDLMFGRRGGTIWGVA